MSYVVLESRLYIICTIYIVWGDGSLRERAAASALHNLRYTYEYTSTATQWEYGEKGCCTYGTRHRDLFSLLPHIGSFVAGRIHTPLPTRHGTGTGHGTGTLWRSSTHGKPSREPHCARNLELTPQLNSKDTTLPLSHVLSCHEGASTPPCTQYIGVSTTHTYPTGYQHAMMRETTQREPGSATAAVVMSTARLSCAPALPTPSDPTARDIWTWEQQDTPSSDRRPLDLSQRGSPSPPPVPAMPYDVASRCAESALRNDQTWPDIAIS